MIFIGITIIISESIHPKNNYINFLYNKFTILNKFTYI